MPTRSAARRTPVLRNTCTVVAILGAGLIAGACLGETSLMNFHLSRPDALFPHNTALSGDVNGYLSPSTSRGQTRRSISQPRGLTAHHTGL